MTDNRDVPDRIWITKEIRPYKVKKPKLLPEVENFEYAYVPKLVEKVKAKMAELVDDTEFLRDAAQQYAALAEVLMIIEGE